MHYYGLNQGPEMIRLYRTLGTNQRHTYAGLGTISEYSDDSLFLNRNNPYSLTQALLSHPLAIQNILGRPKHAPVGGTVNVLTQRPEKLEWDWQSDVQNYGSMLTLNSALSQQTPSEHYREHGVSHPTFVGDLTEKRNDWEYWYIPDGQHSWFGALGQRYSFPSSHVYPLAWLVHVGYSTSGYPMYYTWYNEAVNAAGFTCDAYDLSKNILSLGKSSGIITYTYGNGDIVDYTDFDGSIFRDGNHYKFDVSYTFTKKRHVDHGDFTSSFRVNINFFLEFREVWGNTVDTDWHKLPAEVTAFADYSQVSPLGATNPDGPVTQSIGDGIKILLSHDTEFLTQPLRQSGAEDPYFYLFRKQGTSDVNRMHTHFSQEVWKRMGHIRPSSFISSADALDKSMVAFSGNLLQNLQHIKDIASLFPDPADFERLITKAIKGDPSAIKEVFDLISSYILKYRFQIAPLLRDLEKARELDLVLVQQAAKVQELTTYGQFHYVFTDDENWMRDGKLELVTRSKVRFISDPSTLMGQLLMANSIGLLPTLSRIWQLLPFSFVVDWFTNMSKRLHLVDDQILWLALRVAFCTHSYKVTYYPSEDYLSEFNLANSVPGEPFGVSMYIREFTRITPRLVDSQYDFLRVTRGPDPVTVGALMWQILA